MANLNKSVNFQIEGGQQTFTFELRCNEGNTVVAASESEWLHASVNNNEITVSADNNSGGERRNGIVTLKVNGESCNNASIHVQQEGNPTVTGIYRRVNSGQRFEVDYGTSDTIDVLITTTTNYSNNTTTSEESSEEVVVHYSENNTNETVSEYTQVSGVTVELLKAPNPNQGMDCGEATVTYTWEANQVITVNGCNTREEKYVKGTKKTTYSNPSCFPTYQYNYQSAVTFNYNKNTTSADVYINTIIPGTSVPVRLRVTPCCSNPTTTYSWDTGPYNVDGCNTSQRITVVGTATTSYSDASCQPSTALTSSTVTVTYAKNTGDNPVSKTSTVTLAGKNVTLQLTVSSCGSTPPTPPTPSGCGCDGIELSDEPFIVKRTVILTVANGGNVSYNGFVVANSTHTYTVNDGDSATFEIISSSGYVLKSFKVNDVDVTSQVTNNQYTTTINRDTTAVADFHLEDEGGEGDYAGN